jgi:RimJ/RimL family protein N-acetyltransferase
MPSETVRLRQWKEDDLDPFAEMNADPEVIRYFVKKLTRAESRAALARFRSAIDKHGWGRWGVDIDGAFAGFTGQSRPTFDAQFTL